MRICASTPGCSCSEYYAWFSPVGINSAPGKYDTHLGNPGKAETRNTHLRYAALCVESTCAPDERNRDAPDCGSCAIRAASGLPAATQFFDVKLGIPAAGDAD